MRYKTLILGAGTITTLAVSGATPTWKANMGTLRNTLTELLPLVYDGKRFDSTQNEKKIKNGIDRISKVAHRIQPGTIIDQDPVIPMISQLFAEHLTVAGEAFDAGNKAYARSVLKTVTGYCVSCHTRGGSGSRHDHLKLSFNPNRLGPFERAEYYAASRMFDRAFGEYEAILKDSRLARSRRIEWERSAHYALALAVRVDASPKKARSIAKRVSRSRNSAGFLKEDAKAWLASITDWKKERPRIPTSEEGMFAEATRLFDLAQSKKSYPTDRVADIELLRSSALLHSMLQKHPKGKRVPEALYLLGMTYLSLPDLGLWSLHELLFEECVRRKPAKALARNCYLRYEEVTYLGYSGSGGVSVPEDVLKKLTELRKLAGLPGAH